MSERPLVYQHHRIGSARKAYQCASCPCVIEPGQPYHRHCGIWDKAYSWATIRLCSHCEHILRRVEALAHPDDEPTELTDVWNDAAFFLLENIDPAMVPATCPRFQQHQRILDECFAAAVESLGMKEAS